MKLNIPALWTKWRDNNFLSDNWQGKRYLSIMENGMSNNVAAILNSDMAAIYVDNFHMVKNFLGIKSLYFLSKVQQEVRYKVL